MACKWHLENYWEEQHLVKSLGNYLCKIPSDGIQTDSGDNEKSLQPHQFHITRDDLHFKGLLPTIAPAASAHKGHWDLCCMLYYYYHNHNYHY